MTELTVRLARAMGMSESEIVHIRRGALLHDIGKMGIPDAILLKPGPLDDDEWTVMRRHPSYGYELLAPIAHLHPALDIPYCHHEKWDGSGYPRGLSGDAIPLARGSSPSWMSGTPCALIDLTVRPGTPKLCAPSSAARQVATLIPQSSRPFLSWRLSESGGMHNLMSGAFYVCK